MIIHTWNNTRVRACRVVLPTNTYAQPNTNLLLQILNMYSMVAVRVYTYPVWKWAFARALYAKRRRHACLARWTYICELRNFYRCAGRGTNISQTSPTNSLKPFKCGYGGGGGAGPARLLTAKVQTSCTCARACAPIAIISPSWSVKRVMLAGRVCMCSYAKMSCLCSALYDMAFWSWLRFERA